MNSFIKNIPSLPRFSSLALPPNTAPSARLNSMSMRHTDYRVQLIDWAKQTYGTDGVITWSSWRGSDASLWFALVFIGRKEYGRGMGNREGHAMEQAASVALRFIAVHPPPTDLHRREQNPVGPILHPHRNTSAWSDDELQILRSLPGIPPSSLLVTSVSGVPITDATQILEKLFDILRDKQSPTHVSAARKTFRRRVLRLSMKLSWAIKQLPSALILKGIRCHNPTTPRVSGGFADVYFGTDTSGEEVAMKRIRPHYEVKDIFLQALNREIAIWSQLDHPNILPLLGVDVETFPSLRCLISPWMRNGHLRQFIEANNLPVDDINRLLEHIADGMAYLHRNDLVHGDLRGPNILIDDTGNARIADFGLTRISGTVAATSAASAVGQTNVHWMAPELLRGEEDGGIAKPNFPCDVFSYGRVCLEAYTLQPPFGNIREAKVILKVAQGVQIPRPLSSECRGRAISDDLWHLMESCWSTESSKRPSASDVFVGISRLRQTHLEAIMAPRNASSPQTNDAAHPTSPGMSANELPKIREAHEKALRALKDELEAAHAREDELKRDVARRAEEIQFIGGEYGEKEDEINRLRAEINRLGEERGTANMVLDSPAARVTALSMS